MRLLLPFLFCWLCFGQTIQSDLFVLASEGQGRKLKNLSPARFGVQLDSYPVTITKVSRARSVGGFKIFVVLDLASIPSSASTCLVEEMRMAWSAIPDGPPVYLFVVPPVPNDRHFHVASGTPHDRLTFFERDLHDPPVAPATDCLENETRRAPWRGEGQRELSRWGIRGIIDAIAREPGPTAVLWIGQDFGWFEERLAFSSEEEMYSIAAREKESVSPENAVSEKLEIMSKAGAAFFPFMLPDERRRGTKAAERLSTYAGGRVMLASREFGPSLRSAIQKLRDGLVVRIEAPPISKKRELLGRHLRIWWKRDEKILSVTRAFATADRNSVDYPFWYLIFPVAARLFLESYVLPVSQGCAGTAEDPVKFLTLAIPRSVAERSKYKVGFSIEEEVLVQKQKSLAVREELDVQPLASSNSNAVRFCAELPFKLPESVQIVVFSEAASWIGIAHR